MKVKGAAVRENVGRVLCLALGALYMAGAVPLFNFGQAGAEVLAAIDQVITQIANAIGVWPWLLRWLIGPIIVGGPLALVWIIAGPGVKRILWFLGGIALYVMWWIFGR